MVVQWFGLNTSTAGGPGLIPSWGTEIPHVCSTAEKRKRKLQSVSLGFDNIIENTALQSQNGRCQILSWFGNKNSTKFISCYGTWMYRMGCCLMMKMTDFSETLSLSIQFSDIGFFIFIVFLTAISCLNGRPNFFLWTLSSPGPLFLQAEKEAECQTLNF